MTARLTSETVIGAIRRRTEAAGGMATVIARGDATSGAILLALAKHGATWRLLERGLGPDGDYRWIQAGPDAEGGAEAFDEYIARRRRTDPDLWVVELDAPETGDWLAEMTGVE